MRWGNLTQINGSWQINKTHSGTLIDMYCILSSDSKTTLKPLVTTMEWPPLTPALTYYYFIIFFFLLRGGVQIFESFPEIQLLLSVGSPRYWMVSEIPFTLLWSKEMQPWRERCSGVLSKAAVDTSLRECQRNTLSRTWNWRTCEWELNWVSLK